MRVRESEVTISISLPASTTLTTTEPVPRTSTLALTNATCPYALALANTGWVRAIRENAALALGVNAVGGELTYAAVGEAFGIESVELASVL